MSLSMLGVTGRKLIRLDQLLRDSTWIVAAIVSPAGPPL